MRQIAADWAVKMIKMKPKPDRSSNADAPPLSRRFFRRLKSLILQNEILYKATLAWRFGRARPALFPLHPELPNRVLLNKQEIMDATRLGRRLGLPLHRGPEKNWDQLEAVYAILSSLERSATVLDAGAEMYSNVLPALFHCGFRNLYGMNLSFTFTARRGPIQYLPGDITRTGFADGFFDAVTCMSVIEHGVPVDAYLQEMFRILKPGGILITSTDYFPEQIDTQGQVAHGAPIKIFSKGEIQSILTRAEFYGFEPTANILLDCVERPIRWERYGLDYTFLIFTLRKPHPR